MRSIVSSSGDYAMFGDPRFWDRDGRRLLWAVVAGVAVLAVLALIRLVT